jgi:hypothetical protein
MHFLDRPAWDAEIVEAADYAVSTIRPEAHAVDDGVGVEARFETVFDRFDGDALRPGDSRILSGGFDDLLTLGGQPFGDHMARDDRVDLPNIFRIFARARIFIIIIVIINRR